MIPLIGAYSATKHALDGWAFQQPNGAAALYEAATVFQAGRDHS